VVRIKKDVDVCTATQLLIQELSNLSFKKEADTLATDAKAGKVSRQEYIKRIEENEFKGVNTVLQAFDTCKDIWDCKGCVMENFRPAKGDFEKYLELLNPEHKETYGKVWDKNYKEAYEERNGKK
jgi:hypothetical protein